MIGKRRRDLFRSYSIRFWPANPTLIADCADNLFELALWTRDASAAERALTYLVDNPWWTDSGILLDRDFGEGLLARMRKDEAGARAAFTQARLEQEKSVQAMPDYATALCVLGLIDAALGPKEDA